MGALVVAGEDCADVLRLGHGDDGAGLHGVVERHELRKVASRCAAQNEHGALDLVAGIGKDSVREVNALVSKFDGRFGREEWIEPLELGNATPYEDAFLAGILGGYLDVDSNEVAELGGETFQVKSVLEG